MDNEHRPPYTICFIPLKPLLFCIALGLGLFLVFERPDRQTVTDALDNLGITGGGAHLRQENTEIVATPEMIERAVRRIETKRTEEAERFAPPSPGDRYLYTVVLRNGEDIEAVDVVVKPDTVTMVSAGGAVTTIARSAVKHIRRSEAVSGPGAASP